MNMNVELKTRIQRVFFEKEALNYPMGQKIFNHLEDEGHRIEFLKSHNRVSGIPGKTPREAFFHGKNTLVVGVRKNLNFAGCKPSAHFQLPLVTGCQGVCEYCYLNTQLGKKPYTRIYVNIDEILAQAAKYIEERKPDITSFEAAATSDPVSVEPYSGALAQAISFFAGQEFGRLRFVSKFPYLDSLLHLEHRYHTRIRFSINTQRVITSYEHRTPQLGERLFGLSQILEHGYPSGVIIAPVFLDTKWKDEYSELLELLKHSISQHQDTDFHFEIISHRFTRRARNNILEVFPHTTLPMNEESGRSFKYGQFGYGKFIYSNEQLKEMKNFFSSEIMKHFPLAKIDYII